MTQQDPKPLNVAIVGGGLAGLATAAVLRNEGHNIEIFESSSFLVELGAGIGVPPNALRAIRQLLPQFKLENLKGVEFESMVRWNGEKRMEADSWKYMWTKFKEGYYLAHRIDLHNEFKRLALDPLIEGGNAPATLHLGNTVTSCDFSSTELTLGNGETRKFDLIIGADGVKSKVRECMIGKEFNPPATGWAGFRWVIDSTDLEREEMAWLKRTDSEGSGCTAVRSQDGRLALFYPVRHQTVVNVIYLHPDPRDQEAVSWNADVTVEHMLEVYKGFPSQVLNVLKLAENRNPRAWQMRQVPVLPTWIKGNTCITGDAAHAMLPALAQGFSMAMEDAGALGVLFQKGTRADEVADRLKMYERLRKPRAEFLAAETLYQARTGLSDALSSERVMGYDVVGEAKKVLQENIVA